MSKQSHAPVTEAGEQRTGFTVFVILAILTIAEYVVAVGLDSKVGLIVLLSAAAIGKCWAIVVYFMHIARLWRGEEAH